MVSKKKSSTSKTDKNPAKTFSYRKKKLDEANITREDLKALNDRILEIKTDNPDLSKEQIYDMLEKLTDESNDDDDDNNDNDIDEDDDEEEDLAEEIGNAKSEKDIVMSLAKSKAKDLTKKSKKDKKDDDRPSLFKKKRKKSIFDDDDDDDDDDDLFSLRRKKKRPGSTLIEKIEENVGDSVGDVIKKKLSSDGTETMEQNLKLVDEMERRALEKYKEKKKWEQEQQEQGWFAAKEEAAKEFNILEEKNKMIMQQQIRMHNLELEREKTKIDLIKREKEMEIKLLEKDMEYNNKIMKTQMEEMKNMLEKQNKVWDKRFKVYKERVDEGANKEMYNGIMMALTQFKPTIDVLSNTLALKIVNSVIDSSDGDSKQKYIEQRDKLMKNISESKVTSQPAQPALQQKQKLTSNDLSIQNSVNFNGLIFPKDTEKDKEFGKLVIEFYDKIPKDANMLNGYLTKETLGFAMSTPKGREIVTNYGKQIYKILFNNKYENYYNFITKNVVNKELLDKDKIMSFIKQIVDSMLAEATKDVNVNSGGASPGL